jgi:Rab GDP dissociation inhibitor
MHLNPPTRPAPPHRYVQDYDQANPKTHQGMDATKVSMGEIYKYFGLDPMTVDFVGHAIALHRDDSYISKPALDTINRIKLYNESLYRYEGLTAPYIYPRYGLGELPQVRCC